MPLPDISLTSGRHLLLLRYKLLPAFNPLLPPCHLTCLCCSRPHLLPPPPSPHPVLTHYPSDSESRREILFDSACCTVDLKLLDMMSGSTQELRSGGTD